MWPWTPTSSAHSFQPAGYPHMQHVGAHPSFPASRLPTPPTGFASSQPANYYPSLGAPNVGYSGGHRLIAPQTLPLAANWVSGQLRNQAVEESMSFIQAQHPLQEAVMPSPVTPSHPGLQERPIQNSFTPTDEAYQRNIFTPPSGQPLYRVSPSSQQNSGHFPGVTPTAIHPFHQSPVPADSHTPAFQASPHALPSPYQPRVAHSPHDFQQMPTIDKTPASTSPFQPPQLAGGSNEHSSQLLRQPMEQCPPDLGNLEQQPPELVEGAIGNQASTLIQERTGYSTGQQSNPFSVDFLLRDRPSNMTAVDGEFSAESQQTSFPTYPQQQPPPNDHTLLPFDGLSQQTDGEERPFSPPELVPMETTLDKGDSPKVESCNSHRDVSMSSRKSSTGNENLSICENEQVTENKSVPFQLADTEVKVQSSNEQPIQEHKEGIKDSKKNAKDKYLSPLIRHQCNRGYESSDDDDVFLPNPTRDAKVAMETNDEPVAKEDKPEAAQQVSENKTSPPKVVVTSPGSKGAASGTVVIKRGRGTAKTLDLQKLQLPLSQGWRRLVRKRVGPDQVRVDICYIAPEGKRLRTFPEIQNHLDSMSSSELTLDHFTFSKKVDLGEVLDGVIGEASPRGRRGRGRGRGAKGEVPAAEGSPPDTPTPGRGRGRGGRGRGRPRKTAEASVRGEPSQLATHSARAQVDEPQGKAQGIGAVSRATAVALIQKAIHETNLESQYEPDHILTEEKSGVRLAPPAESADQSGEVNIEKIQTKPRREPSNQIAPSVATTTDSTPPPATKPDVVNDPQSVVEDGLPVLNSSVLSNQVLTTTQPPSTANFEFHMSTPSSIGTSLQGVGKMPGRGRGRKRKSLTHPSTNDPVPKRPRGRPKGSSSKVGVQQSERGGIKKRRGRKPKTILSNTSHTILRPIAPSLDTASVGVTAPPTVGIGGSAGTSVIVSASEGEEQQASQIAKIQEEKRRQLLLKARADKARKKEARNFQRSLSVNQRKLAQRQRRDRERLVMKQAREKQEKLTRQKEAEDHEMRRQTAARQREVDNQRKARERTMRLLAHLKQQEIERNRRLYQQQLEMEKMAQLKRPVEDLEVRESAPLPPLSSFGWVQLPAQAFADLLMVLEFGRSFVEFLELECGVPSLADVYLALYNFNHGRVLMELVMQLLKAALYDPGTRKLTASGSQLEDVVVTPLTVSELLRLFLTDHIHSDHTHSDLEQIARRLRSSPLQSLRPSEKVKVLSYLVEELVDSVSLMREVDTRMEQLASLRREKWKISLKMKRFRLRLSSEFGIGDKARPIPYSGRGRPPKRAVMGGVARDVGGDSSDEGEDGDEERGGVASDSDYSEEQTDEETPDSKEELQRRLKALKKKFVSVRKRIHKSSRLMRKFPLGQDRYARQYWVLPSVGGVIVEGVETSLDRNLQVVDAPPEVVGVANKAVVQSDEEKIANQSSEFEVDVTGCDEQGQSHSDHPVDAQGAASKPEVAEQAMETEINHVVESKEATEQTPAPTCEEVMDSEDQLTASDELKGQVTVTNEVEGQVTAANEVKGHMTVTNEVEGEVATPGVVKDATVENGEVEVQGKSDEDVMSSNCDSQVSTSHATESSQSEIDTNQFHTAEAEVNHTGPSVAHIDTAPTEEELSKSQITSKSPEESETPKSPCHTESPTTNSRPESPGQTLRPELPAQTLRPESPVQTLSPESHKLQPESPGQIATLESQKTGPLESSAQTSHSATPVSSAEQENTTESTSDHTAPHDPLTIESNQNTENAPQTNSDPPTDVSLTCTESLTGEESKDGTDAFAVTQVQQQPWFSLAPRQPCEVNQLAYLASQSALGQQQYIVAGPSAQYAYMTPDGQIVAAAGVPQVQYGLVGNTIVQMPTQQYIAVDSSTGMVLGQQGGSGIQYAAVTGGEQNSAGVQFMAVGGTGGYITMGGGGQMLVQAEGGGQMMVVQDQNGQQTIVSVPTQNPTAEESVKPVTEVASNEAGPSEVKGQTSVKEEDAIDVAVPKVATSPPRDTVVQEGEMVRTVTSNEMSTTAEDSKPQAGDQSQYVTAMVPGGPDGTPQYVSLPADPRVISGQCSYAVLQQPDGSQQIVLVDNNTIGSYQGTSSADTPTTATEVPPPRLMDNEQEGAEFVTSITLMYAQEPLNFTAEGGQAKGGEGKEKNLRELLEEQDIDLTHGWWNITRTETVDRLLRTLCTRGVREKCLSRYLQKNKDTISAILKPSCLKSFESSFKEHLTNMTKESMPEVNPLHNQQGEKSGTEEVKIDMDKNSSTDEVKMESDAVDAGLEEGSTEEVKMETGGLNNCSEVTPRESTNQIGADPSCDMNDPPFPGYCLPALLAAVKYLEGMQSRLIIAKLHNDGVELWDSLSSKVKGLGHTPQSLTLVSDSLLELESTISRVYLKHPLRDKKLYMEEQEQEKESKSRQKRAHPSLAVRRDSAQLELPSEALLSWRRAVGVASSASQLAVCMSELEVCVAWEKSNTVIFCQVCHGGENESLLLLCDRCDKGTHTYCCKPKLADIPDGDWFCYDCVKSNPKYRPCYVCDSKRGVLLSCAVCPRNYHKHCLNPPLTKHPSSPWKCPNCKNKPIPQSRQKEPNYSSRKRDKVAKSNDKVCHTLLKELESHDDAWPFLIPVEKKKFPSYYKVIRKPMDLQTMRTKLEEGKYMEGRDLFAADARLIFANCSYYNEDDSEIGLAGHGMSNFFEKRWSKLCS